MTIGEFFESLEKTDRDWCISGPGGMIRQLRSDEECGLQYSFCPLTAISGHRFPVSWRFAASEIGLDYNSAMRIVNAADGTRGTLRNRMLRACGLEEPDE